jgi:hypothetical protein
MTNAKGHAGEDNAACPDAAGDTPHVSSTGKVSKRSMPQNLEAMMSNEPEEGPVSMSSWGIFAGICVATVLLLGFVMCACAGVLQ